MAIMVILILMSLLFIVPEASGDFGASFIFDGFLEQGKYSFLFFFNIGRRRL
jgi:hypothetical protein